MKKLFLILLTAISITSQAQTTWHVDNTGDEGSADGSEANPIVSLQQLEDFGNSVVQPGDSVLFHADQEFLCLDRWGGMFWWGHSGFTCPSNVYFGRYGTGANPNFLFPNPSSTAAQDRIVMSFEGVDNIVIENLDFNDHRFPDGEKVTPGYTGEALLLGERGEVSDVTNSIVRNCNFNKVGMAVVIGGYDNLVTQNTMSNFTNVLSTNSPLTEDYGATAVTLSGSRNWIINNTVEGCWAASRDFVWNGGFIEYYGECDSNVVMFNKVKDCGGTGELGSSGSGNGDSAKNNLVAFNFFHNCGGMSYTNWNASFSVVTQNMQYLHNVIIEDTMSRFSGPHTGEGVPDGRDQTAASASDTWLFLYGPGSPAANIYTIKNNVILISTGIKICGTNSKYLHDHNIVRLGGSSTTGWTAGTGDITTSAALFQDESDPDPWNWNVHPIPGGPLENAGTDVTSRILALYPEAKDRDGVDLGNPPEAGNYEIVPEEPPAEPVHRYYLRSHIFQRFKIKLHQAP